VSHKVSIVVTTKNEEENLPNCLKSISEQDYSNFEIIVVDNGSTDQTTVIARQFTELVFDKGPERSAQRNYGMLEIASGEYVLYVDADMLLTPDIISVCVNQLETSDALALYIPEVVLGKTYFARVRRFERSFYDGTVIDAARFFRRSVLLDVNGFDEELFAKGSGEDWDLDKLVKLRGKVEMINSSKEFASIEGFAFSFAETRGYSGKGAFSGIFHNEEHDRLLPYLRKKRYYSEGFSGYISKWGEHDPDILKQFGVVYRLFTVFTENKKWKRFFSRPFLAVSVVLLKFLVGLSGLRGVKGKI
jgi:glycosyltransferase involved in cell wall biosynthesis